MKYIIMIVAAYAAMAVGMNVAHANIKTHKYSFTTTYIVTEADKIPACIISGGGMPLVTPNTCDRAVRIMAQLIRKDDPTAILDFTLDGLELSKS
ncbi:hypothetical protein PTXU04_00062 [Escherichia phage PTXU04]|uniref:Uncharacterized protein n=1 Tax=Escherichia phage PTXU04 TaxID=2508206 RepID=A0A482MSW7_9CAUD|nr:hypothetical protein HOV50_gp62 [Escherichia phage PTXU04]QBQ76676.1 hypothetical protein PTXU04_00062 [Escherichia phage PTXU04]